MTSSTMSRFLLLSASSAPLGAALPACGDATKAEPKYVSAKDLAAAVATATADPFAKEIAADPSATTLIIHRNKTGEVEVHTVLNDIFIVESGHATVLVGGQVKGKHELKPAEWRGGEIVGGGRHELSAGDLLLIPAGEPHQCILKPGDSFTYLTIKTPTKAVAPNAH